MELIAIIVVTAVIGITTWLRRRAVLGFLERHTRPDDADVTDTFFGEVGRTEVEGVFHGDDYEAGAGTGRGEYVEIWVDPSGTSVVYVQKNSVANPKQEG